MAKKKQTKAQTEATKETIEGFQGGLKLPMDRVMENGNTLRTELMVHVKSVFDQEKDNQSKLVAKLLDWEKMYAGIKPPKSWPYPNCSNVAIPVTRSSVDTIFVRIFDAIFNKLKVWIVKPRSAEYVKSAREVEDALDWFQRNILKLKSKLTSPLLQGIKCGTGIGHLVYESKKRTVYRYATPEETADESVKKYQQGGKGPKLIKYVETTYEGPNFYPVPREDFLISTDSCELEGAYLVGHKKTYRKKQLETKARQGIFDKEIVDKITGPDMVDKNKESRAAAENKDIQHTPYTDPYDIWKLWLRFDVDDDGEEDDICVDFHPGSGEILRGIYNPLFSGTRPYARFVFYPKEYSFDGEGICQILEHLQITLDTMVNQMIDRVTQINAPALFVQEGSGLEDLKTITPGMVRSTAVNPANSIYEFRFSDVTVSLANEVGWILSMMDRAVGITPISQGISTAERPVAKDTFAQQEETNKKFKYGTDNIRDCITELGYQILEFIAQYQPSFTYNIEGENGMAETRTVQFPVEHIRDAFELELAASSELMNQEVRREMYLTVYQLLSDFMTKVGSMAQALTSPQVPSEFKKVLFDASDKSVLIMNKILENFPDLKDKETLILDLSKVVDGQKVLMQSADIMAQQAQMAQQQQGPPPGQGGQPLPSQNGQMPMTSPDQMLAGQ